MSLYFLHCGPDASHFSTFSTEEFDSYRQALDAYEEAVKNNERKNLITLTKVHLTGVKPFRFVDYQEYKKSNFVSLYGGHPLDFIDIVEKKAK